MILRFFIVIFLCWWTEAGADIYKYVSEEGVECYTDSPSHKSAVLILRESRPARKSLSRNSVASRQQITRKIKNQVVSNLKVKTGTSCIPGNLPVHGIITSPVGMRKDPIDGLPRVHNGIDIAVPEGTAVKPVAAGTIVYSGSRSGYGNMIVVEHQDGMRTIYAHNSVNLAFTGERIERDSTIALSGSTGRSTGPHLHFEAWKDGINITSAILAYGSGSQLNAAITESSHKKNPVRTAILPDGSLLFTNLPYVHP